MHGLLLLTGMSGGSGQIYWACTDVFLHVSSHTWLLTRRFSGWTGKLGDFAVFRHVLIVSIRPAALSVLL